MDGGILSDATLLFRNASIGWATVLAPFMLNLLFHLAQIGFVLFIIGVMCGGNVSSLLGGLLRFWLGIGFAIFMVEHGWEFVDQWFSGVAQLATILGAPAADPSAVANFGPVVADPIMKSLASQGLLSYLISPTTYVFMFAGIMICLAFVVLALVLMGYLLMSYFLVAACPFFFAFAGTPFTAGLTFGYLRLVFGTMGGLFCVMLMTAITSELGALMEQNLRTKFLATGVTLTLADYIGPLIVGFVLCGVFIWIPLQVSRAMGAAVPSWSGGGMLWGFGMSGASGVTTMISSMQTSSTRGSGAAGGSSQGQIGSSSGSSSGGIGAARQPQWSTW